MAQESVFEHDGGDPDDEAPEVQPKGGSLFDHAEGAEGGDAGAGKEPEAKAQPAGKQAAPDLAKLQQEHENLKRALAEERSKRQEYQRMLDQLMRTQQPQPQPPPQAKPDEEEDPLEPIVDPLLQRKVEPLSQELRMLKATMAEQQARLRHPDYDQVVQRVLPMIQQDQTWYELFLRAGDPAEFAYNLGRFLSIDEQIEAAKEAGRREVLSKLNQGKAPEGLSGVSGGRRAGMETGPTPEQAAKANLWQWDKVPRDVIERSLEE